MKVTPLEIKQKQFEKKTFGGIDKDEVQAFLNSLSLAWEKMLEDQSMLKSRLEYAEKEVSKLREVESSLYKTLKTAEETGQKALDQANQQAQLIVSEARLKADTLQQEARWKASKAMEQAEDYARKSYDQMVHDVKILEKDLHAIENMKDSFLSDIRIIANDLLEKANKADQKSANIQFKVPPPPVIDLVKPVFETKAVEDVIDELDVPATQQTIGFEEPDTETTLPVEAENTPQTIPVPVAESPVFQKPVPVKSERSSTENETPPAVKPVSGGSFFDRI